MIRHAVLLQKKYMIYLDYQENNWRRKPKFKYLWQMRLICQKFLKSHNWNSHSNTSDQLLILIPLSTRTVFVEPVE